MSTRHVIAAADPARAVRPEALDLDVDALLEELGARPELEQVRREPRSAPPRRRRLDLALAAVVAAFIAAVAFLPASFPRTAVGDRSTSTPTSAPSTSTTSGVDARAAAEALLDEISVPAAAAPVSTAPARYLAAPREGLACKGTATARPRYWVVPDTTLTAVAAYLREHRPAGADRLPFNHDTDVTSTYTRYRPAAHSMVVIALAETPTGIGIRADADVFLGTTCLDAGS